MAFKVKFSEILCMLAVFVFVATSSALSSSSSSSLSNKNSNNKPKVNQFYHGLENFGASLYTKLAGGKKNTIFSPLSLYTCLGMTRMGAQGNTAKEMDKALGLGVQVRDLQDLAKNYHDVLEQYQDSPILATVNKIYVMEGHEVNDNFNELLTDHFYASADAIDFANNKAAAQTINSFVESETNHLIKNFIDPKLLDDKTRLVLVNAIYFNGAWANPFHKASTREMDFYFDETKTAKVRMMHTKAYFKYAKLPELDATALEMPYEDSDLSMLIFLPNSPNGLVNLEKKLKTHRLSDWTRHMRRTKVVVDMPRFKAVFKTDLKAILKRMGMKRMFTQDAEFGGMLKGNETLAVSSIIHQAFIEVSEDGTEAAAATGAAVGLLIATLEEKAPKEFKVDRPFYYVIKNEMNVELFKGCIKNEFKN